MKSRTKFSFDVSYEMMIRTIHDQEARLAVYEALCAYAFDQEELPVPYKGKRVWMAIKARLEDGWKRSIRNRRLKARREREAREAANSESLSV